MQKTGSDGGGLPGGSFLPPPCILGTRNKIARFAKTPPAGLGSPRRSWQTAGKTERQGGCNGRLDRAAAHFATPSGVPRGFPHPDRPCLFRLGACRADL